MRQICIVAVTLLIITTCFYVKTFAQTHINNPHSTQSNRQQLIKSYGKLPITFKDSLCGDKEGMRGVKG